MGMFDTIIGELECPRCGKMKERELQTHRGPCLLDTYYIGEPLSLFILVTTGLKKNGLAEIVTKKPEKRMKMQSLIGKKRMSVALMV